MGPAHRFDTNGGETDFQSRFVFDPARVEPLQGENSGPLGEESESHTNEKHEN